MMRNDDFLYQLKSANPIETVVGTYVNLIRRGHNYVCLCPFHSENTPSCTIYTDTQSFYCYGCGAGGDTITFVMKMENLDFSEAIKLLAQRSGIAIPSQNKDSKYAIRKRRIYEANREAANYFYINLIKGKDKRGLKYLAKRKLLPQTIKKYGLGYAPDSWDSLYYHMKSKGFKDSELFDAWLCEKSERTGKIYDVFRNRIIFPIIDLRGNIIGFGGRVLDDSKPKYLNTNKTLVFDKGSNLFSLNFAKNYGEKKLILSEGYMDVIAMNQAGFENAVATLGTAITEAHARLIRSHCDEVILCYDNDIAGKTASQKAINLLSAVGVSAKIIKTEDAKDPDEYIKKFGSLKFKRLLENSVDANIFMLEKCKDGLDLNSETGRIEFTKRAIKFLSGIENEVERDIYISRTADISSVSIEVIKNAIDSKIYDYNKKQIKQEWNNTINTTNYKKDDINPESSKFVKENKAEEEIIRYILKYPENANDISEKAPPDIFVTDFNRRVYTALCKKMKESDYFTLSLLSDEFSVDELGRISGIDAKNKEIEINETVFYDCIAILKAYNKSKRYEANENIDDNSLLEMFKKKVKKK